MGPWCSFAYTYRLTRRRAAEHHHNTIRWPRWICPVVVTVSSPSRGTLSLTFRRVSLTGWEGSVVPKSDVNNLAPRQTQTFLGKRSLNTTHKVMVGLTCGFVAVTGSIVTYICCRPPRKGPGPRRRTQDSRIGEDAAVSGDPREEPGDEEPDIGLNGLGPRDTTKASHNPARSWWPGNGPRWPWR